MTGRLMTATGGYRIDVFAEQDAVRGEDIVELWVREGVLSRAAAARRVPQILVVASDAERRPVGVSTAYLDRNPRLQATMWHVRVFVAKAHRQFELARGLALAGRDHLAARFVRGEDRRAIGIIYMVESQILKDHLPQASWPQTQFLFIGVSPRGDHVRVYYFPGAVAPEPGQGST